VYQAERPTTLLEVLAEAGGIANDAGDTAIVTRPSADPNDKENPADAPPISNEDVIPSPMQKETTPMTGSAPVGAVSSQAPVSAATTNTGPDLSAATKDAPVPTEAPALSNTITVNLNELMESGDAANNIILQSGDIVTVPHAGIVYVLGAIAKPGGYVLANDRSHMTTLKMLALAGGFNRTAKSDKAVIIRRDRQGQQHEQTVNLKQIVERKAEDVRLDPSDILYVPDSKAKQILYRASEAAVALASGVALYRVAYR
jgi:protein involved in polysaccharide export with SLBB domain